MIAPSTCPFSSVIPPGTLESLVDDFVKKNAGDGLGVVAVAVLHNDPVTCVDARLQMQLGVRDKACEGGRGPWSGGQDEFLAGPGVSCFVAAAVCDSRVTASTCASSERRAPTRAHGFGGGTNFDAEIQACALKPDACSLNVGVA